MSRTHGFSLVELLVTLSLLAIALSFAAPAFSELVAAQRTRIALHDLTEALLQARATAITTGKPISLAATGSTWANGWTLFVDDNNDGIRQPHERLISVHESLEGIEIRPDSTSRKYIHYIPRGSSIQQNGAFHAGNLVICGKSQRSYKIVINRVGRIRYESAASTTLCPR
ncbi:type II secretion system protein H [compost metagenome]